MEQPQVSEEIKRQYLEGKKELERKNEERKRRKKENGEEEEDPQEIWEMIEKLRENKNLTVRELKEEKAKEKKKARNEIE